MYLRWLTFFPLLGWLRAFWRLEVAAVRKCKSWLESSIVFNKGIKGYLCGSRENWVRRKCLR